MQDTFSHKSKLQYLITTLNGRVGKMGDAFVTFATPKRKTSLTDQYVHLNRKNANSRYMVGGME